MLQFIEYEVSKKLGQMKSLELVKTKSSYGRHGSSFQI